MDKISLSKKAIKGVKWTSISQILKQVLQYLTTFILVNLLDPSDFGIMAMALIVIGFLQIFKDLGTSAAIIQLKDVCEDLLSSIFYVNVGIGLIMTTLIYSLASFISYFFDEPKLIEILQVLSLTFTISSLSVIQKTLIEKELNFNLIAKIEIFSIVFGAITGIALAFLGYGVWSLVFQSIVNVSLTTIFLILFKRWIPKLIFKWEEIKKVSRYSSNLVGYNIFNYAARNVDYLIIGKFLGDTALGHYYLAYRIMLYPLQNITYIVSRVLFPVYSKIQDDNKKFANSYLKVTKIIAFITFPLMLGVFSVSNQFVNVFFSDKWDVNLLITLLLIFSPLGLVQSISSSTGLIFQAKGKTDWMLWWSVSVGIIFTIAFIIGLNWGVIGVAVCYLISYLLITYHAFAIPFRLIELNVFLFLKNLLKNFIISITMCISVLFIGFFLSNYLGDLQVLIINISIGILIYTILNILFNKKDFHLIKDIIKESFT